MPVVSLDEFEKMAPKEPVKMSLDEFEKIGPKNEGPSSARSFLGGLGQATTMGFGDELSGLVGSKIVDPIAHAIDPNYTPDTYQDARNFARKEVQQEQAANPKSYLGGELTGAISQAVAMGKLVPSPNTSLGRIAMAMGYGGAQGLGTSNADLMEGDIATAAKDVGKGAAIGGATAGAFEAVPAIGKKFGELAENRASKAVGLSKADRIRLGKEGVSDLGRTALDEGVIGNPFNNSPEEMLLRAQDLRKRGGEAMGDIYRQMDEKGLSKFSPQDVIDKFKAQEGGFYSSPANRDISGQFDNILETIGMRGENLPFEQAQALKEEMGKLSNFKSLAPSEKNMMARKAYNLVNQGIDEAAQNAAPQLGQDAKALLQAGKDKYAAGAIMGGAAGKPGTIEGVIAKEGMKPSFGVSDILAGGAGAALGMTHGGVGAELGALGAIGAKHAIKAIATPQNQAWGAEAISKILTASPKVFGKFAPALQSAAARGGAALSATNFILSQNHPEYREMQKNLMEQKVPDENRGQ